MVLGFLKALSPKVTHETNAAFSKRILRKTLEFAAVHVTCTFIYSSSPSII
jgi:hypothetical protein